MSVKERKSYLLYPKQIIFPDKSPDWSSHGSGSVILASSNQIAIKTLPSELRILKYLH